MGRFESGLMAGKTDPAGIGVFHGDIGRDRTIVTFCTPARVTVGVGVAGAAVGLVRARRPMALTAADAIIVMGPCMTTTTVQKSLVVMGPGMAVKTAGPIGTVVG